MVQHSDSPLSVRCRRSAHACGTFHCEQNIDADFFRQRLSRALARRERLFGGSTVYRLVHGEADGLPGLIVDRYDDVVVAQFLSAGVELHKAELVAALLELLAPRVVYERSDTDTRTLEGLKPATGLLFGSVEKTHLEIEEHGLRYGVDIENGHKTGFYLDQRDNRALLARLAGNSVLNCFCYTGGFSLAARKGGANEIVSIDTSADALAMAQANWQLNRFTNDSVQWREADVFASLRELRDQQPPVRHHRA